MKRKIKKDVPLSESSVSLKLADIQKRCAELIHENEEELELTLEEPILRPDEMTPYARG